MRALSRRSGLVVAAVAAAAIALSLPGSAETDDAIARLLTEMAAQDRRPAVQPGKEHRIEPAQRPHPEEERRLVEEIEMLERARAEAEARRTARPPAGAPTGEADERRHAEQRQLEEAAKRTEADRKSEEERRLAADRRRADEQTRLDSAGLAAGDADYARMEAEREAEAVEIDKALRKAREAWLHRRNAGTSPAATKPDAPGLPPPPSFGPAPVEAARSDPGDRPGATGRHPDATGVQDATARRTTTRVTILIVLEPGHRGIRRHNRTADPLLCGETGCYVSAGAGATAEFLPRRRALGVTRTLGDRAGACRNSLGCIFRGVDLVAYPAVIQPVDMRLLRHDRREPHVVDEASRCRLDAGRLSCTPVLGPDYVMWIVPEAIAERAGSRELERVVDAGLRSRSAAIAVGD